MTTILEADGHYRWLKMQHACAEGLKRRGPQQKCQCLHASQGLYLEVQGGIWVADRAWVGEDRGVGGEVDVHAPLR